MSVFLCYSLVVTWVGMWSAIVAFPGHSNWFFSHLEINRCIIAYQSAMYLTFGSMYLNG